MAFDPTAFESLEALDKEKAKEADRAQIDAKIATDGIDIEGALDAMYGNIKKPTDGEIQEAKNEEAQEPDADALLAELDGNTQGEGNEALIGKAGDDELATGKTGGEKPVEEIFKDEVPKADSKNPEEIGNAPKKEETKNLERKETIDTNKEGEYSALFTDFAKTGKLTPDELTTVLQANITADNFNGAIEGLNISPQAKTGITKSLSYLNSEGHQKQSRDAITKDFPDMIDIKFKDKKGADTLTSDHAEAALLNISRHYIGEPTADPSQKEADLHRAISMASSAVSIKGGSLLSPQNEFRFQQNKKIIGNPKVQLKEKFNALVANTELTSTEAGIKSSSHDDMTDNDTPGDTDFEAKLIAAGEFEAFQQAQEALLDANTSKNPTAIKLAEAQRDEILARAKLTQGEASLLAGGELDKASDTLGENTPTKTP